MTQDGEQRGIAGIDQNFRMYVLVLPQCARIFPTRSNSAISPHSEIKALSGGVVLQAEIHFKVAQMIVAAPGLRLDSEVRGFLYLKQETARTDGMGDAGRNQINVPGLDGQPCQKLFHAVRIRFAPFDSIGKFLVGQFLVEAEENGGVLAGGKDNPAFCFSEFAVEILSGKFAVRMGLRRKADRAVQNLDQHAPAFAVSQHFGGIAGDQIVKICAVLCDGNSFLGRRRVFVQRFYTGNHPFLRVVPVLGLVAEEIMEQLSAGVDAEYAVPPEKNRFLF